MIHLVSRFVKVLQLKVISQSIPYDFFVSLFGVFAMLDVKLCLTRQKSLHIQ